jgi:hypothetical protein
MPQKLHGDVLSGKEMLILHLLSESAPREFFGLEMVKFSDLKVYRINKSMTGKLATLIT